MFAEGTIVAALLGVAFVWLLWWGGGWLERALFYGVAVALGVGLGWLAAVYWTVTLPVGVVLALASWVAVRRERTATP